MAFGNNGKNRFLARRKEEETDVFSRVHATLYVTMSVRWLVGRLVGWSVGQSVTHLFFRLRLWSPAFALTSGALQREREKKGEEEEETKEHRRVKRISTCGN